MKAKPNLSTEPSSVMKRKHFHVSVFISVNSVIITTDSPDAFWLKHISSSWDVPDVFIFGFLVVSWCVWISLSLKRFVFVPAGPEGLCGRPEPPPEGGAKEHGGSEAAAGGAEEEVRRHPDRRRDPVVWPVYSRQNKPGFESERFSLTRPISSCS